MPSLPLAKYFRLKEGHERLPDGTREMGLYFFLASLGVLFLSLLCGYFTVRWMAPDWPPPGTPPLPSGLWASTGLILAGSVSVQLALGAIRNGNRRGLLVRLRWTAAFGLLFLAVQILNWMVLERIHGGPGDGLYGFLFFFLTLLHALHVIGGLAPLLVAGGRARAGRYTKDSHYGIRALAVYWHFLGGMWLLLFGVLYLLDRP